MNDIFMNDIYIDVVMNVHTFANTTQMHYGMPSIIFLSCGETSLNVSNTTRACLRQSAHESAARLRAGALLFR